MSVDRPVPQESPAGMFRNSADALDQAAPYDHRNLQSLFGYGRRVHAASGGICQLCGYGGGGRADPDLWRQLTVEHLIGGSQGGHLDRIRAALRQRFPQLTTAEVKELADRVEITNMVTACHFCNSMTSREIAPITMDEVIASAAGDTREEMLTSIATRLQPILEGKRLRVRRKLEVVRDAFHAQVAAELNAAREALGEAAQPPGPDVTDTTAAEPEYRRAEATDSFVVSKH